MRLKVGQILSNSEISRMFNVCVQRGIRYRGNLRTGIHHVVLITAFHKTQEDLIRNPYSDKKSVIGFFTPVKDVVETKKWIEENWS